MSRKPARGASRERIPLSRERVLDAALALADAEGIQRLTMRRLAAELGVEAMTIYYHVPNKNGIFDALVERVIAEIQLPEQGTEWRPALRSLALSAYEVLGRHRCSCRARQRPRRRAVG